MTLRAMANAVAVSLVAGLWAGPAAAQVSADPHAASPWRHIDPAHEDLDLNARSLRKVDPGLEVFSGRYRVQQHADAIPGERPSVDPQTGLVMPHAYRYVAPGMEIRMGRAPDYLVLRGDRLMLNAAPGREGDFRTLIPSDSVYVLTPPRPVLPTGPRTVPSAYRDGLQLTLEPVTLERASGTVPADSPSSTPRVLEHYTQSVPSPLARIRRAADPQPAEADTPPVEGSVDADHENDGEQ